MEEQEFDSYLKAGEIAKAVKDFIREIVKPNMKLIDIALEVDKKILDLGGTPAFPVNLSIDEIAAHYTPELNDEKVAKGLLKVDFGVAVNGFIADTSLSFDLTPDKRHEKMIEANKIILEAATSSVKKDMKIKDVGEKTTEAIKKFNAENDTNFSIIKSLSGHSLGEDIIHAGLTISNYKNENQTVLNEVAFAIEPFLTTGVGDIYEGEPGGIYSLQSNGQTRDPDARKLLEYIFEEFSTRPFCVRWLEDKGFKKLRFSLSILTKQGIIHHYPKLIEKSKHPVSQVENTFLIANGKVIRTTE